VHGTESRFFTPRLGYEPPPRGGLKFAEEVVARWWLVWSLVSAEGRSWLSNAEAAALLLLLA